MNFEKIINIKKLDKAFNTFSENQPFDHFVCDDFFVGNIAIELSGLVLPVQ